MIRRRYILLIAISIGLWMDSWHPQHNVIHHISYVKDPYGNCYAFLSYQANSPLTLIPCNTGENK